MSSLFCVFFFFFKQKTAYEMRISDWSSDVCSSDLKRRKSKVLTVGRDSRLPARLPGHLSTLNSGSPVEGACLPVRVKRILAHRGKGADAAYRLPQSPKPDQPSAAQCKPSQASSLPPCPFCAHPPWSRTAQAASE